MNVTSIRTSVVCYQLSTLLVVSSLFGSMTFAQNAVADFEIPAILSLDLVENDRGIAKVTVEATDNIEVTDASLFYRYSRSDDYKEIDMTKSGDGVFSTLVDNTESSTMYYYVVVNDSSGNKTLRGNAYFPSVAELTGSTSSEISQSKPKYLYYILGALALGAVAGLAGDSGGGGTVSNDGTSTCCTVTITTRPE